MRRTIATLGGLALALGFSQFPEYAQQYEQRLGGAVDELRIVTAEFDAAAAAAGLSRQAALERYAASPDSFLVGRGTSMAATFARYDALSADLADLKGAGPVQRLRHLGQYLDSDIGARALENFKPAVPVTVEGLFWALGGFLIGYFAFSALMSLLTLPFRRRRRSRRLREI